MFKQRENLGYTLLADLKFKSNIPASLFDYFIFHSIRNDIENEFNVVDEYEYTFEPDGKTIVFVLSESHAVIHTFPEINMVSLDIYTCSKDGDKKLMKLLEKLKGYGKVQFSLIKRSFI